MQRALLSFITVAALGSATLVSPSPAQACSCGRPGVQVTPVHGADSVAPLNAEIRVTIWIGEVKLDEDSLVVQEQGKKDKRVAFDKKVTSSASQRVLVLKPQVPLAPDTRYEVLASSPGGGKPAVVGEFRTGTASDEKPPEWKGVTGASLQSEAKNPGTCSTGETWIQIDLADEGKVSDDSTPADAIVFGVWLDDKKSDAAPTTPPLTVVKRWGGPTLVLGRRSICQADNFVLPRPGKGKKLELEIAPIDLSGKIGKPARVSVDLDAPKPAKKP